MNCERKTIAGTKSLILAVGFVLATCLAAVRPAAAADDISFDLSPSPKTLACLSGGSGTPQAHVTVHRSKFSDKLVITGKNIKPNLAFDMFTVQRSNLLSDGSPDPNFTTFGLAWYQSDLHADDHGTFTATIRTILLDQIFGFDPDVALAPLNTFHLGFWFNKPNAAKACGFDVNHPTPFNGEHKAGPVAMITVPDADTNLGPLCTDPNNDGTCNP